MPDHTIDLPGLLGARICHDLISPVGAIGNGIELLALSGNLDGPERDLVSDSTANANARLQLFRLVFGRIDATSELAYTAPQISALLSAYFKDSDLEIDWQSESILNRPLIQSILLTILCLETVIGRSGKIVVQNSLTGWQLSASAIRGLQSTELLHLLKGNQAWPKNLTPAQVQFPLARRAYCLTGLSPQAEVRGSQVSVTLMPTNTRAAANSEPSRRLLQDT